MGRYFSLESYTLPNLYSVIFLPYFTAPNTGFPSLFGNEVLSEFEKSETHTVDPIQIGQDVAKVEEYLELTGQGCGFLVVLAPEDEEAKRAVRLVKPFGWKFAEKYNRLTLEELA